MKIPGLSSAFFRQIPDTAQAAPPESGGHEQIQTMLSFRPQQEKYRTVAEFHKHADFAIVKQQLQQELQLLRTYAVEHGSTIQAETVASALDLFSRRLFEQDFFASVEALIYGEAKRTLDTFVRLLADPSLPLTPSQRADIVQELAEGLTVCAGGAIGKILHALNRLVFSTADIKLAALLAKEDLIDGIIHEYTRENLSNIQYHDQNEVHIMNGLHNALQSEFGLSTIPDITQYRPHSSHIEACQQKILAQLTPVAIAKHLASQCQAQFTASLFADAPPPPQTNLPPRNRLWCN